MAEVSEPTGPNRAPHAWPALGHIPQMQWRFLKFLNSLPAHGDVVEIRVGPRRAYVLCHPEPTRQVLVDFETFDRSGVIWDRVREFMGHGLPSAPYEEHAWQRRMVQPLFHRDYLRRYAAVMQEEITSLMQQWRPGQRINVGDEMFKLSASVSFRALFGAEVDSDSVAELQEIFSIWLKGTQLRMMIPFWSKLPTIGNHRYSKALARWGEHALELISRQRNASGDTHTVLQSLLASVSPSGRPLTDKELSEHVAMLLLAGINTTSIALTWCLYLLSTHPSAQEHLQSEADRTLQSNPAAWQDLPKLPYALAVAQEAMRLYPPAFFQPRTATRDTILAGRLIRAGSLVIYSPYVIHRRSDIYPEPQKFDPARWMKGPEAGSPSPSQLSQGAYIPFGLGATKCVADRFAVNEVVLALASICAQWSLRPARWVKMRPKAKSSLEPSRFIAVLSCR